MGVSNGEEKSESDNVRVREVEGRVEEIRKVNDTGSK